MEKLPVFMEFGQADIIQDAWGLDLFTGQRIAAIVAFAGSIEYHLERALWKLRGINPCGIRPDTDAKMITDLIGMLEAFSQTLPASEEEMLLTWCVAARRGFTIRHNVAHGVPMRLGSTMVFMRNPRWAGEVRKREPGDFWADENACDMICNAFAVLLRIIVAVEKGEQTLNEICTPMVLRALREARSLLSEFADPYYNSSFEKY